MVDQVIVDRQRVGLARHRLDWVGLRGPVLRPSGRSKKRRVGARRLSGVESTKPASLSRATNAATDDFERNPNKPPIDEYEGSTRCRA